MSAPLDIRERLAIVRSLCRSRDGASQVLGILLASVQQRRGREAVERLERSLVAASIAIVDCDKTGEWR